MDIIKAGKSAVVVGNVLKSAYEASRKRKRDTFFNNVDVRYELLSIDDQKKLLSYINTEEGQNLVFDYVNAVINTPSKTVNMALALLYCNDPDFNFTDDDKRDIVFSLTGISDCIIDIFIELTQQPTARSL